MTLCIAASALHQDEEGEEYPVIVLCCDERGDRGIVSADDSDKIRWVESNISVLLAGPATKCEELFVASLECLKAYSALEEPDELDIDKLKQGLRAAAQRQKRGVMDEHARLQFGMCLDEFLSTGRAKFGEAYFQELFLELRMLQSGAHMIVATFGQGEAILLRVAGNGEVYWDPGWFSTIGTGSPIAEAFLVQRPKDAQLPVKQCVYCVYEAKFAAEKNKDVGPTTVIEVMPQGLKRFGLTEKQFDALDEITQKHLHIMPVLDALTGPMDLLDEDEEESDVK